MRNAIDKENEVIEPEGLKKSLTASFVAGIDIYSIGNKARLNDVS